MARKIKVHEEDAKTLLIIAFESWLDSTLFFRDFIVDIFDSIYPQLSQSMQEFFLGQLQLMFDEYFEQKEQHDDYPEGTAYWKRFYERISKLKQEIPYNNPDQARGN